MTQEYTIETHLKDVVVLATKGLCNLLWHDERICQESVVYVHDLFTVIWSGHFSTICDVKPRSQTPLGKTRACPFDRGPMSRNEYLHRHIICISESIGPKYNFGPTRSRSQWAWSSVFHLGYIDNNGLWTKGSHSPLIILQKIQDATDLREGLCQCTSPSSETLTTLLHLPW